ncbi:MAG: thiamine pyrophosphate-binding protein [Nitrososphaeria archaeon]
MSDFMIKGSDCIVECLLREEVETVYTVSAENILPLLKSSLEKGIKVVNSKLELSAAFMAVVHSRIKNVPGVLIVTSGPGLIGSLSPIAEAMLEGDPLVVFATVPLRDHRTSHMHQLMGDRDQLEVVKPITKAQYGIEDFRQISENISRAFGCAKEGKPGPVYIEVSIEVLMDEDIMPDYRRIVVRRPTPDPRQVDIVVNLLERAKLPVILAGRGVYLSGAREELVKAAEVLGAPVATLIMAKGLIPNDHLLYAGVAAGMIGNMTAYSILSRSDLVLAIGNRFSEMGTGRYSMDVKGKLVHVNIDSRDIGRVFKPDVAVVSDAKEFLTALLKKLADRGLSRRENTEEMLESLWGKELEEMKKLHASKSSEKIESYEVVDVLAELADDDMIIVADVGAHRIETFTMPIHLPGTYISTTSYVSMGIAVPGAVAASIDYPHRQVVGIVGDGGFFMTGLEFATAIEYGARPIVIIFNDSSYKVLRIYEKAKYRSDTKELYQLPTVDFSQIASALGVKGIRVEKREDLHHSLEEALRWRKGPVLVDILINPNGVPIPFQHLYGARDIRDIR